MPVKVSPVIPESRQEDAGKENVSPARVLDKNGNAGTGEDEVRLGRLLGRLAAGVTLSPARAAAIWEKMNFPPL
jgi:hypothetical protein